MIDEDATVIKKLEAAGAVLCAKLTLGALAWGDVWFDGMTRNPWDTIKARAVLRQVRHRQFLQDYFPSLLAQKRGDQSFPLQLFAAQRVYAQHTEESVRTGAMALSWSMDKIGPICRSAEDLAIVFNAIYGLMELIKLCMMSV